MNHKGSLVSKYKLISIISSQFDDLSEDILTVVKEMHKAGVRIFEVTHTTPKCLNLIKEIVNAKLADVLVGVGTIQNAKDLRPYVLYVDFIVSDIIPDKSVFEVARKNNIVMIPGALTPNEIKRAYVKGADFVKVFPASWIGPDGFRAIKRTHGHIPLIPTGGIKSEQIKDYFASGASAFGIGGGIFKDDYLKQARAKKDYSIFYQKAEEYLEQEKPRIWGLGDMMIEFVFEKDGRHAEKIPQEIGDKYIKQMDLRMGPKKNWRSGSLCRDLDKVLKTLAPSQKSAFETGKEIEIKEGGLTVVVRSASDVLNALTVPALMGAESILLSARGTCPSSRFLENWYKRLGFNLDYCKKFNGAHCSAFFLLNIGKKYSRFGSASARAKFFNIPYKQGDIFHFTGISQMSSAALRRECLRQVKAAVQKGVKISYNLNDRPALRESRKEFQSAFEEVAPYINHLFLAIDETLEVFNLKLSMPQNQKAFIQTSQKLSKNFYKQYKNLETLIITAGKLGFCLFVQSGVHYHFAAISKKHIVEPIGAGDSLIGGFLYALSRGLSPKRSAELANITAALSLLNRGSGGLDNPAHSVVEIKDCLREYYGWGDVDVMRV